MSVVVEKTRIHHGATERKLPEGWRWVRLGDHVTKIGSGITPTGGQATYLASGVPLIRSQNVQMNSFSAEGLAFISRQQDAEMEGSRVIPGDVLLNITGASIGRVCVAPSKFCPANVNQHVSIIRGDGTFDPAYLSFYISGPDFQSFIMDIQGGATRQALTKTLIENFRIPLPPLPEQKRIAGLLSEQMAQVERTRKALQDQLHAAAALPAACLREVFNSPQAQSWPHKRLGDVCQVKLGKMLSPKSKTGISPFPYLRNTNVQWNRFDLEDISEMDFTEDERRKFELHAGDLLVCEGGEPGRAAVWNGEIRPCYYQKALHRLRPIANAVDPHFVMYRLWDAANSDVFIGSQAATTIAHLPADRLRELPLNLPPLVDQKRLAGLLSEKLSKSVHLRQSLESQLSALDHLPAALLRRAFAGEL